MTTATKISAADVRALRDLLEFARTSLSEIGPCDHAVNVCACDAKRTIECASAALHGLTDGAVGDPPQRDPDASLLDVMPSWMLGHPVEMD
jgi:hypothetical protein